MKPPFPDPQSMDRLQSAVTEHWGLEVPAERWHQLRGRIGRLLRGNDGDWGWFHPLHWDHPGLACLAPLITVGETYFFRDADLFETLQAEILPTLSDTARSADRPLAIGSAGCSTGEEIYSIAILVRRLAPDFGSRHLTLLGIDINREAVEKARQGRYGTWSFRDTPERVKNAWFSPLADGSLQIRADVRRLVRFQVANLASAETFPFVRGAFDLLFCRNVLMYFQRDVIPAVVDRLTRALRPGGILVVAPSETHLIVHANLEMRQAGARWIFVKSATAAKRKPASVQDAGNLPESPGERDGAPDVAAAPKTYKDTEEIGILTARSTSPDAVAVSQMAATRRRAEQGARPSSASEARPQRPTGAASTSGAVAPLQEAVSSQEGDRFLEMAIRQAREQADRGQLQTAREWAERALRMAPVQPSAHLLLGVILHDQNDLTGARESLKRATFLDPDSVLAHFHLGMIALRLRQINEARTALQRTRALLQAAPPAATAQRYQGNSARDLQRMVQMMLEQIHD